MRGTAGDARRAPLLALLVLSLVLAMACRDAQGALAPRRPSRWLQKGAKPTLPPTLPPKLPPSSPVAPDLALEGESGVEVSRTSNKLNLAVGLLGLLGSLAALALAYRRHRAARAVNVVPLAEAVHKHVSASEFLSGAVVVNKDIASAPRQASNPLRQTASSVF